MLHIPLLTRDWSQRCKHLTLIINTLQSHVDTNMSKVVKKYLTSRKGSFKILIKFIISYPFNLSRQLIF
jgi:hypothetical protein